MYSSNGPNRSMASPTNVCIAFMVALVMAVIGTVAVDPGPGWAFEQPSTMPWGHGNDGDVGKREASCWTTAFSAFKSCRFEIKEEYWMAVGKCANLSDREAATECYAAAREEMKEAGRDCRDQYDARLQVCDDLGQAPYVPDLMPEGFIDPEAITAVNANPYFPMVAGTQWVYEGETRDGTEVITVTVTDAVKEIEYPAESGQFFACVVVRDVVTLDGDFIEDTDDWYAQDLEGNVLYFGELSKNYEDGELVDLEGSWKAGVDGAIPGIVMPADPEAGDVYRQEYALGEAEDMATVVSRGEESVVVPYGEFSDDILKTGEYTPIEPEVVEFKYYAPMSGMVLEVNPDTGERVELIEMTMP